MTMKKAADKIVTSSLLCIEYHTHISRRQTISDEKKIIKHGFRRKTYTNTIIYFPLVGAFVNQIKRNHMNQTLTQMRSEYL